MFGLSRKKPARPDETPPLAVEAEEDVPGTLSDSFRVLEIATLALDAIAHGLTEARTLARTAARPDGAAQRGLIAARYAFLKNEIERRSLEQAIDHGEKIAMAFGVGGERCGSLVTQDLPTCTFETAEEGRALTKCIDELLRAVDEDAMRIREAAGHIADRLAATPAERAPARDVAAAPAKRAPALRRRAA